MAGVLNDDLVALEITGEIICGARIRACAEAVVEEWQNWLRHCDDIAPFASTMDRLRHELESRPWLTATEPGGSWPSTMMN